MIDAKYGGNSARWINHSCAPNCVADEEGRRIFIRTLRKIRAGEELNYDYGLMIDALHPKLKTEYLLVRRRILPRHLLAPALSFFW